MSRFDESVKLIATFIAAARFCRMLPSTSALSFRDSWDRRDLRPGPQMRAPVHGTHVLIEYGEEQPARAALETSLRMTLAAMHGDPFDVAGEIETLRDLADDYKLGPSTGAIVEEPR
jgi:hypothetical protein